MGLFSFLKNAGAKLFDKSGSKAKKEEEAKESALELTKAKINLLHSVVEGLEGIEVRNLDIALHEDTVIVTGEVDAQADREKVILALGNVQGVAQVDDRISVVTPEPEADFYEVKSGDSLSKIAKKHYGDAMKYPVIFEANKPMLKSPDLIYPGQVLRLPKL